MVCDAVNDVVGCHDDGMNRNMALFTTLKSLQIHKHDTLLISLENNKTGLSWKTYGIKALKETHFVCLFSVPQGIYIYTNAAVDSPTALPPFPWYVLLSKTVLSFSKSVSLVVPFWFFAPFLRKTALSSHLSMSCS